MLKKILIALVVVVAAVLGLALIQPDRFSVARSASISAPPERVFEHINSLKAFNRWSPWVRMEPTVQLRYSGPDAGVGAAYTWLGDKTGEGGMTIIESNAPTLVAMRLRFVKPFESENRVDFSITPAEGGSRVTWTMSGPMPFLSKLITLFADMDRMVGPDFEQGLANLKADAEKT